MGTGNAKGSLGVDGGFGWNRKGGGGVRFGRWFWVRFNITYRGIRRGSREVRF